LIEIIKRKILEVPGAGLIFGPGGLFFEPPGLESEDMRLKIKR